MGILRAGQTHRLPRLDTSDGYKVRVFLKKKAGCPGLTQARQLHVTKDCLSIVVIVIGIVIVIVVDVDIKNAIVIAIFIIRFINIMDAA